MNDVPAIKPTTRTTRSTMLRSSMMTPTERARGRFMRSPDHDAGTVTAPPADPVPPADQTATPPGDPAGSPADASPPADATVLNGGDAEPTVVTDGDPVTPPGAPEKYELAAPEGVSLDTETLALAEPIFRELNLDNDGAQKLTDVYAQVAPRIAEQAVTADREAQATQIAEQRKAWAGEAKADPEIGGQQWAASLAASAKALDRLGAPAGSPFRQLLDDSGLGNHPEMIRMFTRIGKTIGEDVDFVDARTTTPKTTEEKYYGKAA